MNYGKEFTKGILKENPTLVGLLGMCPTLAITTSGMNGIGKLGGRACPHRLFCGHQP